MSVRERRRWLPVVMFWLALALTGCGLRESPILDPKGPVTLIERDLLFTALGLMMIVAIPVFLMTVGFVWRYRASNRRADYAPDWDSSPKIDAVVWLVPALIVVILGVLVWHYTHKLDPYRELAAEARPLQVQAVAQDWKWLFLYPEQNIAVVNELVFPSGTPLSVQITSDTVMNSLLIPALGGQIYAMAGMQTRLNLLADQPGRFVGRNMQYSGNGFPDQQFEAIATSPEDFEAWVAKVRQSQHILDAAAYQELAIPSERHPVTYYAAFEPDLFDRIIAQYAHGGSHSAPSSE